MISNVTLDLLFKHFYICGWFHEKSVFELDSLDLFIIVLDGSQPVEKQTLNMKTVGFSKPKIVIYIPAVTFEIIDSYYTNQIEKNSINNEDFLN